MKDEHVELYALDVYQTQNGKYVGFACAEPGYVFRTQKKELNGRTWELVLDLQVSKTQQKRRRIVNVPQALRITGVRPGQQAAAGTAQTTNSPVPPSATGRTRRNRRGSARREKAGNTRPVISIRPRESSS